MIDSNHNYYSSSNVVLVILYFSTLEGSKLNNEIDFYHYRFTVHPKPAAFFYRREGSAEGALGSPMTLKLMCIAIL